MAFALTAGDWLGIAGLVLVLGAFISNLAGRLPSGCRTYCLLNAVGSGLLMVYSVIIEAWVFVPLNAVWSAAAVVELVVLESSEKSGHRRV